MASMTAEQGTNGGSQEILDKAVSQIRQLGMCLTIIVMFIKYKMESFNLIVLIQSVIRPC